MGSSSPGGLKHCRPALLPMEGPSRAAFLREYRGDWQFVKAIAWEIMTTIAYIVYY